MATEIEATRVLIWRALWVIPERWRFESRGFDGEAQGGRRDDLGDGDPIDLVGAAAGTPRPAGEWLRDAKIYPLFEGTAEIQRMVISRMQAREYAERLGFAAEIAAAATAPKEPVPA